MTKMDTADPTGKVLDTPEQSELQNVKSSSGCTDSSSIEPDPSHSSFPQQPPRPAHWFRDFLPLEDDEDPRTTLDTSKVELSLLCSKCQPIRDFLQVNTSDSVEWSKTNNGLPHDQFPSLSPLLPKSFAHYETGELLEASSKHGCHLCTLIWESLVWPKYCMQDQFAAFPEWAADCRNGGALSVTLRKPHRFQAGLLGEIFDAFAYLDSEIVRRVPLEGRRIDRKTVFGRDIILSYMKHPRPEVSSLITTKSDDSMNMVQEWLSSCLDTHPECMNYSARPVALPTRLLRISPLPDGGELVRLVETKDIAGSKAMADMRYTALSYCWGGKAAVELSMANRENMRTKGIPTSQLSRTIRDAVWVTKNLGLAWIWVDSLCIIQDSPDDWERESLLMCSVYNGCFLSIAARGAKTAADGLFARRDPLKYAHCLLAKTVSEPDRHIFACPVSRTDLTRSLAEWPLEQRGWVVQERLLPPRTVTFGPYLTWNCDNVDISEFGVEHITSWRWGEDLKEDSLPKVFSRMVIRPRRPLILEAGTSSGTAAEMTEAKLYLFWTRIVTEYSKALLSVQSDRYAALSGVMAAFEQRAGWTQVGGLWNREPFLLFGLLWRTGFYHGKVERTGVGPSWSWVAVDCAIAYEELSLKGGALPLASATASSPKSITLRRAVLLEAEFSQESWLSEQEGSRTGDLTVCGWPDEVLQKCKAQSDMFSRGELKATFDVQAPNCGERGLLVPLCIDRVQILGLVVQKRGDNSFERLGFWEMSFIDAELRDEDAAPYMVQSLVLEAIELAGRDIVLV